MSFPFAVFVCRFLFAVFFVFLNFAVFLIAVFLRYLKVCRFYLPFIFGCRFLFAVFFKKTAKNKKNGKKTTIGWFEVIYHETHPKVNKKLSLVQMIFDYISKTPQKYNRISTQHDNRYQKIMKILILS